MELKQYFQKISEIHKNYQKAMSFDKPALAPAFNLVEPLMGRADTDNYELQLSSAIKYLLDPLEKHNQQRLFLDAFLRKLHLDDSYLLSELPLVTLEKKVSAGRRIDLGISWDKYEIGIEFKIWSKEGKNQISNYIESYSKKGFPYKILFITPYGNPPKTCINPEGLRESGVLDYYSIEEWLRELLLEFVRLAKERDPRLQYFLIDLAQFIQKRWHPATDTNLLINHFRMDILKNQKETVKLIELLGNDAMMLSVLGINDKDSVDVLMDLKRVYSLMKSKQKRSSEKLRKSYEMSPDYQVSGAKRKEAYGTFTLQKETGNSKRVKLRYDNLDFILILEDSDTERSIRFPSDNSFIPKTLITELKNFLSD